MASSSQSVSAPLRKTWINPEVDESVPWKKCKVIIQYLNDPSISFDPPFAYLGPVIPLSVFPEQFKDCFPNKENETDILASASSLHVHYFLKSARLFRTPPLNINGYHAWLNRVEAKKSEFWKKIGIFHLIQLSKHVFRLDPSMLGAASFF